MRDFSWTETGDIHLGVQSHSSLDSKTGIDTSILSTLNCLNGFTTHSVKNKVDFSLFLGDYARKKSLNELERSELFKVFKKLSDNEIDVYALLGNHDESFAKGTAYNIKSLKVLNLRNVHVIDAPTLITKKNYNLILMPFIADITEWVHEYRKLRKKIWGSEKKIVVALHGNIQGVNRYSECSDNDEPDEIPKNLFDDPAILHVACGHNHRYQVISKEKSIVAVGSIDRVSFEERDDKKGFIHCKLEDKKLVSKFIEVDARKFIQLDLTNKIIPKLDYKKAIVKVVLDGEFDYFDEENLQRKLEDLGAESVFFKNKKQEQEEKENPKVGDSLQFISMKDRIKAWTKKNVPKNLREEVIKKATQIIEA